MSRRRFGPSGLVLALAAMLLPAAAEAAPAFTTERLSLRAGPSTEYPAVALLEPGVQVEVLGCLDGYGWCDAVIGQDRGWLPGAFLQAPYYQQREPLIGIAPALGLPIIGFTIGNYWDRYYRGRPWYRERDRWVRHAPPPPPPRWHPGGPPPPPWRGPDRHGHGGPGPRYDGPRHGDGRPPGYGGGRGPDMPRHAGGPPREHRGGPPGHDRGPPQDRGPQRGHDRGHGHDRGGAGDRGPR